MPPETTLAQSLRNSEEGIRYDAACKRVLSEKIILAHIMKGCLSEYQDCDVNEIAEKYIEGQPEIGTDPVLPDENDPTIIQGLDTADKSLHEGTITYDIRFHAIAPGTGEPIGLVINVEAQKDFHPGYPLMKRAVYYCSRMLSSQYGRVFTNSHYEKLEKVYSIWVCIQPSQERGNTINRYHLIEEQLVGAAQEPPSHYDLLTVVFICLGEADKATQNSVLRLLDVVFSPEPNYTQKRKILQDDFHVAMTDTLSKEVESMSNLSEGLIEETARKVTQEVTQKKDLSHIQNLVEGLNISIEQAMKLLKIPDAECQKYKLLLENQ
jgi:hypothetical protein